jgi:RHS repeat-associated protein
MGLLSEAKGFLSDPAGNLTQRRENFMNQMFTLNSLNELTGSGRTGSFTVAGTTSSNATSVTVNSQQAALYSDFTFAAPGFTLSDGANSFTAVAQDSLGRTDTSTVTAYLPATNAFSYDLNGNLLSDGLRLFAYDAENQLTNVMVANAWKSEFVYDGKMRRRIRREYSWQSALGNWQLTNEVRYIYDGNLVIQERGTNNLPLVSYTRGSDLSGSLQGAGGIGGLLARTDHHLSTINSPQSTSYYHADGNGNITLLINQSQATVAKYIYDAFGNIISQSGSLADANLYRFSSKECHAPSGLVYYLYRFYDPNLQRWLNRDRIEEYGGINVYGFVGNDPESQADVDGAWYKLPPPGPPVLPPVIKPPPGGPGAVRGIGGGGIAVLGTMLGEMAMAACPGMTCHRGTCSACCGAAAAAAGLGDVAGGVVGCGSIVGCLIAGPAAGWALYQDYQSFQGCMTACKSKPK